MSGFRKQTDAWRQAWESEAIGKPYGDLFFDRATGKLPEMESSKAAAARITALAKSGDSLLDVGCGAGHYYRSIRSRGPATLSVRARTESSAGYPRVAAAFSRGSAKR